MNIGNLSSFLSIGFIIILVVGVIILILKYWKGVEWVKIGLVIVIVLIL